MKIPREVVDFIEERGLGKFGTIGYLSIVYDDRGVLKPLTSVRHFKLQDDSLIFADRFSNYLKQNLTKNKYVSVVFAEASRDAVGYQILGEAEYLESGPLFEEGLDAVRDLKIPAPLKGVVRIKVDSVRSLVAGENTANGYVTDEDYEEDYV